MISIEGVENDNKSLISQFCNTTSALNERIFIYVLYSIQIYFRNIITSITYIYFTHNNILVL